MGLDMYLIKRKKDEKRKIWDFDNDNILVYWRKANQVHHYFCDKGEELEEEISYKIKKEDIEELLEIVNIILDTKKEDKTFDKKLAKKILPTQDGFFFGSIEYDEWYLEDLEHTKLKLEKILESGIIQEEDQLYYLASW